MDGFLIGLWVVRLLFLALLYLFLFQIVRALVRDLRAATRSATAELGRLHVLASPGATRLSVWRSRSMRSLRWGGT